MTTDEFIRTRPPLDRSPPGHESIAWTQRLWLICCVAGLLVCVAVYIATYFGFYPIWLTTVFFVVNIRFAYGFRKPIPCADDMNTRGFGAYFPATMPTWFKIAAIFLIAVCICHLIYVVEDLGGRPAITEQGSYLLEDRRQGNRLLGRELPEGEYRIAAARFTRAGLDVWTSVLVVFSVVVLLNMSDGPENLPLEHAKP